MVNRFYSRNQREIPDIEKPAMEYAERRGWRQYKVTSPSANGFPDRFLARAGRVVLCELKAPGEEPNPQQGLRHGELRAAGVEVVWFDNLKDFCDFFK